MAHALALSVVLFLSLASACAAFGPQSSVPNIAKGVWLRSAVNNTGARCLDGSPQYYAIRKGSSDQTKWVFHIQGGAWCTSLEDCYKRSKTRLGSSDRQYGFNETIDLRFIEGCNNSRWCGNLMVNDASINPVAHDWNAVLITYCDGTSFTGNNDDVPTVSGDPLYFRGIRNLRAIFDDLVAHQGLGSATEVVVGGDSAGGLATWIHTDYIASRVPATARVAGMPDSGFFMEVGSWAQAQRGMVTMANATGGLHPRCVAAHATDPAACIFAQETAPFCSTRMFALQGQYDAYQVSAILHSEDPAKVNPYGQNLVATLKKQVLDGKKNAAFVDSCLHHCGYWDGCLGKAIDGANTSTAFFSFFYEKPGAQQLWYQNETFPCTSCCGSGPCGLPTASAEGGP